jgi:hypothetical protein
LIASASMIVKSEVSEVPADPMSSSAST